MISNFGVLGAENRVVKIMVKLFGSMVLEMWDWTTFTTMHGSITIHDMVVHTYTTYAYCTILNTVRILYFRKS